jgi:ABC-type Fe3+/spermidine/putrescine transport system ATPase subunit
VDSVDGDRAVCTVPGGARWPVRLAAGAPRTAGASVRVMVRPEALELAAGGAEGALPGRVLDRRFAGAATFYRVTVEGDREVLVQGRPHEADAGDTVRLALHPRAEPVAYAPEETER